MDSNVAFLRHALATLAYRGGKALRGAPADFCDFRAAAGTRTPGEILAHLLDLLDWSLGLCDGRHVWRNSAVLPWDQAVARFHAGLEALDYRLATGNPVTNPEGLFQGPIADAFTHVGQISMLRRIAGGPVKGENYYKAEIVTARLGAAQAAPAVEFD